MHEAVIWKRTQEQGQYMKEPYRALHSLQEHKEREKRHAAGAFPPCWASPPPTNPHRHPHAHTCEVGQLLLELSHGDTADGTGRQGGVREHPLEQRGLVHLEQLLRGGSGEQGL
jgi:hypothetical protein